MKLENSDGNYAVITNNDNNRVDTEIYESEAIYLNGIDPFFGKIVSYAFQCGVDLDNAFAATDSDGTKTVQVNIDEVCMTVIGTLAAATPDRFRISYNNGTEIVYIKGDWAVVTV